MSTLCFGCMQQKENSPVCEHCGWDENQQNLPHQLPVGTILQNQYLVGRVLGQGGFGITYMGWDQHLSIPVAIKEYYPSGVVQRYTDWGTNMEQIYSGRRDQVSGIYVIGLREDGRVVSVGNSDVLGSLQQWQDIVYLYTNTMANTADEGIVVGIKADGSVVTNLWCMPKYGVSEWSDIKLPE